MERIITIKSDKETLETLRRDNLKLLLNYHNTKNVPFALIISLSALGFLGFMLLKVHPNFIVISFTCAVVLIPLVAYYLYTKIKLYFIVWKYKEDYNKFINKYNGVPLTHYKLYPDRLIYEGDVNHEYKWSDFLRLIEYNDALWLVTDSQKTTIWLPKSVFINIEDYHFFKAYSHERIKKEA